MSDVTLDSRDFADPPSESPRAPAIIQPPPKRLERFSFTGSARDYFGIWVVNLFLTVVTLGIYSAWAKVRKKRYFYGNTWVAGSNFEYHGNPVAILKGRVIAFCAFVAYTLASGFSPRGSAYVLLALSPLIPFFLVRSMSFNAANSSYRNLRFHFDGRYREALKALAPFILIPIAGLLAPEPDSAPKGMSEMWPYFITPLIMAAFYPYVIGSLRRLHVNRSRFGEARFACSAELAAFYRVYFFAFLLMLGLFTVFGFVVVPLMMTLPQWGWGAVPVLYLLFGAVLFGYAQARVTNLTLNATSLEGGVRLSSTLSARRLMRLYAENLFPIPFPLGFPIPWPPGRPPPYPLECRPPDS